MDKGWAVIVGGSAGMGLELARECALHGHDVLLIARGEARLQAAAADIAGRARGRVEILALDAAAADAPAKLRQALEIRAIRPAILMIGIGRWMHGPLMEVGQTDLRHQQEVGVVAPLALLRGLVPVVRSPGGRIVVLGSLAGFCPMPGIALYSSAKAQLNSAVLSLRQELKAQGIIVSLLAPSVVATEFIPPSDGTFWRRVVDLLSNSPATIGRGAYRGLMTGEPVIAPGIAGKLAYFGSQIAPAPLIAWFLGWALRPLYVSHR